MHVVCVVMTADFLAFSRARGNDLSTPMPEYDFPGLRPGDRWCLCALRWLEALQAGMAPDVVLEATHLNALGVVNLDQLRLYAVDADEGSKGNPAQTHGPTDAGGDRGKSS